MATMAAASLAALTVNRVKRATTSQSEVSNPLSEGKILISHLQYRQFYTLGWVSTTQQLIVMSPSGVKKERMVVEDMCVVSQLSKPYSHKHPDCSDCFPLFLKAKCYQYLFNTALILHQPGNDWSSPNHGPGNVNIFVKAGGSLISNNGMEPSRRCIVLDIEGTTTPISFVTDVLFPYARDNVGRHLDATYDTADTQDDIKLLRSQVHDDLEQGIGGAVPIPSDDAGKEEVIAALVANVQAMIRADRKITALKQLQGHIWRTGFQNNEIKAIVFDDVPEALEKWHALGIKVYIYSSGSRLAQRLIFGNTNYGDLRKYLGGFFDTNVGNKREIRSYLEISESLGVDKPSEILFVTDVYQEAAAAKAAGLEVIISVRPGNGPLQENHGFKMVNSFLEI